MMDFLQVVLSNEDDEDNIDGFKKDWHKEIGKVVPKKQVL